MKFPISLVRFLEDTTPRGFESKSVGTLVYKGGKNFDIESENEEVRSLLQKSIAEITAHETVGLRGGYRDEGGEGESKVVRYVSTMLQLTPDDPKYPVAVVEKLMMVKLEYGEYNIIVGQGK